MRTAECPLCHQQFQAENDEELFKKGREHANEKHADANISDEQIRQIPVKDA